MFIQALVKVLRRTRTGRLHAASCLTLLLVSAAAQSPARVPPVPPRVVEAQRFLAHRGLKPGSQSQPLRTRRAASTLVSPEFTAGQSVWQTLGPQNVLTPYYGAVTGRIASIAIDPSDATGNTIYIDGGCWLVQPAEGEHEAGTDIHTGRTQSATAAH